MELLKTFKMLIFMTATGSLRVQTLFFIIMINKMMNFNVIRRNFKCEILPWIKQKIERESKWKS